MFTLLQDYIKYAESINEAGNGCAIKPLSTSVSDPVDAKLPSFPPLASTFSFQTNKLSNASVIEKAIEPVTTVSNNMFPNAFSFAASKPELSQTKPVDPTPSAPSAQSFDATKFSFNVKKPDEAVPTASAFPSFSFNPPPTGGGLASLAPPPVFNFNKPAAPAVISEGGDDDDEGEPLLEPEVVHRNADDDDDIFHEVDCKLFRFDKEQNEWKDVGKGKFRVTQPKGSDKKRILLRNLTGKIVLNAFFYPKMTFTKLGNKGIRFLLSTDGSSDLKMLMIKTKTENLENTMKILQSCVPKN